MLENLLLKEKPENKPLLRGVIHQYAAILSAIFGFLLLLLQPTKILKLSKSLYAFTCTLLFAFSALYHVPNWKPQPRAFMRRIDHSMIYLQIAGSYTSVIMLAVPSSNSDHDKAYRVLIWIWIAVALGMIKTIVWPNAPKALSAVCYVLAGWAGVAEWGFLSSRLSYQVRVMVVLEGLIYTFGGVLYALRKPNPWPKILGYHEIFHFLTVISASLHYAALEHII